MTDMEETGLELREDAADTLAIFPLAVVLVPGELLPLHIFEERYKALMASAIDGDRRFGLSFVASAEVGRDSAPRVGSVGCAARISAVVPVADGRMNLLAVGENRYRILGYAQYEPYLVAEVEYVADAIEDADEAETTDRLATEVRALFERLAAAAQKLGSEGLEDLESRLEGADAERLSFLVAAHMQIDDDVKQGLLETIDTRERLDTLHEKLASVVEAFEYRALMQSRSKSNGHGTKVPVLDDDEDDESDD